MITRRIFIRNDVKIDEFFFILFQIPLKYALYKKIALFVLYFNPHIYSIFFFLEKKIIF